MKRTFASAIAACVVHVLGMLTVACGIWWMTLGAAGPNVAGAVFTGQVAGTPWLWIALHLGLSAVVWGCVWFAVGRLRKRERPARVIKLQSGTALTEFLIILVPFLLLTSGLAQLAILNTAGLLADVASYNATRAVWVWEPRPDSTPSLVQVKARTAAAMALAPSAPADFVTDEAPAVRELAKELGGSSSYTGGTNATHYEMFYNVAYDTGGFSERITKKLYFAYLAIDMRVGLGDPIESDFTYEMNCVFPWFAYIWGGAQKTVGGRDGYYTQINRRHSLPRQVRPVTP